MKSILAALFTLFFMTMYSQAQPALKLTVCTKIPAAIKSCGGLYANEKVLLNKKQYVFIADFQDKAMIGINGRQISLKLKDSKTVGKDNFTRYEGSGYVVILTYHTTEHTDKYDLESGTLEVIKGFQKVKINIHGVSQCEP